MISRTRRAFLGYAGAIAVLALLPVLPDWLIQAVRAVSGMILLVLAPIAYFAYVPVRFTISVLRFLMLGICVLLGCMVQEQTDVNSVLMIGGAMLATFSMAVGPIVPVFSRRVLYGAAITGLWLMSFAVLLRNDANRNWFSIATLIAPLLAITSSCGKWFKTGQSELVVMLDKWQFECKAFLVKTFSSAASRERIRAAKRERKLHDRLHELATAILTSDDRYRELLEICDDNPSHELPWKIAYWAAISRRDFVDAARIVKQANDLQIDFRGRPDPREAEKNPGSWIYWRDSDPFFAQLQDSLASKDPSLQAVFA